MEAVWRGVGDGGDGCPKGAGVLTTRTRYSREMYRQTFAFSSDPLGYLPPFSVTLNSIFDYEEDTSQFS